jgi:hypothetical protein
LKDSTKETCPFCGSGGRLPSSKILIVFDRIPKKITKMLGCPWSASAIDQLKLFAFKQVLKIHHFEILYEILD